MEVATIDEDDPCIRTSGQYILLLDHHVMSMEREFCELRDYLIHAEDTLVEHDREILELSNCLHSEEWHHLQESVCDREQMARIKEELKKTRITCHNYEQKNDNLGSKLFENYGSCHY